MSSKLLKIKLKWSGEPVAVVSLGLLYGNSVFFLRFVDCVCFKGAAHVAFVTITKIRFKCLPTLRYKVNKETKETLTVVRNFWHDVKL